MTLKWHLVGMKPKRTAVHAAPVDSDRTFCGRRWTVDIVAFGRVGPYNLTCTTCRKIAVAMQQRIRKRS